MSKLLNSLQTGITRLEVSLNLYIFFYRKVKHQEILWNYSIERLQGYLTDDLLKDMKVDLVELGVVKQKSGK